MTRNVLTREIEWGECDPAGIVFNPVFSSWFDHATTKLYEAAGWPKAKMVQTFAILGCPIVETNIKFRAPGRYGDIAEIESSFEEVGGSSFKVRHRITIGGKPCVEALDTRVWTAKDPKTGRLKSTPIPDEIVSAFLA